MAKPIIDVSQFNGVLNWEEIKPQIDGAIIRCGYGGNTEAQDDPQYFRNVSECTRLAIPYGVYLFSYARNEIEAQGEADHVLRLVKGRKLALPIYYDLEYNDYVGDLSASQYTKIADAFGKKIEAAKGFVGIYANLYYWQTKLMNVNSYTRWLAQWSAVPTYDKEFKLWQFTNSGVIGGSSERTDVSKWYDDFLTMAQNHNDFRENAPITPPVTKYQVNDFVHFRALFTSSTSQTPITDIAVTSGTITKVIAGARNPYLINNGTGWVNDSVIDQAEIEALKVNDRVKVKEGALDYSGTSLAPFVYQTIYKVMEINGNRVVIGKDGKVTAAIAKDNLIKV